VLAQIRILHALVELGQSQILGELLEKNLDEDTRGRGRLIFGELDVREARVGHGIRLQEVGKELGCVTQLVGLKAVDGAVLLLECRVEGQLVLLLDQTEALSQEAIES